MPNTIVPISRHKSIFGIQFVYEADEQQLLAAGLIAAQDLPKPRARCRTERRDLDAQHFQSLYRMPDGRVRLTVSANQVLRKESSFSDFMARTVGRAAINLSLGVANV